MAQVETLESRHHAAIYFCKLGNLYHRKRERFFDLCDKCTKSASVVLGASLLAADVKQHAPVVGSAVSSLGLLALVFGYTDRKQRHKELAESFSNLQASIECVGQRFTPEQLDQWHADVQRINAKEPPALGTLVVLCQNEIAVAEGKPESVVPVQSYKVLFANWRDFHNAT